MSSEWKKTYWGDISTLHYGKRLSNYKNRNGQFHVYASGGIVGTCDKFLCPKNGVIVGRKGNLGFHYSEKPFFVIDTAFWLETSEIVDEKWSYYKLISEDISYLDSGSAIPSMSRESFYSIPVLLPSLIEQKRIAEILTNLENKIELNKKINSTLEEIAKALFKSWFIDFDPVKAKSEGRPTGLPDEISNLFPSSFEDSELGEIPRGWNLAKISDICDSTDYVANGSFATLKKNVQKVDFYTGNEAILLRFADFNKNWEDQFSYITQDSYNFLDKSKVFPGDLVVCNVGDVGNYFRAPDLGLPMSLGPNGVLLKNFSKNRNLSNPYFYFLLSTNNFQNQLRAISSGSVQTKFNKTELRGLLTVVPPNNLVDYSTNLFCNILRKEDQLCKQNRILKDIKDAVLPKLISGELRIPDTKKLVEGTDK